ncbi:hypothetical protein [Brevibacterium litoralis]|uniref:hypothetical protein n=1 Tax=Brevibacterium litoralis TaxID=3138935 RepID=UPI0032EB003F
MNGNQYGPPNPQNPYGHNPQGPNPPYPQAPGNPGAPGPQQPGSQGWAPTNPQAGPYGQGPNSGGQGPPPGPMGAGYPGAGGPGAGPPGGFGGGPGGPGQGGPPQGGPFGQQPEKKGKGGLIAAVVAGGFFLIAVVALGAIILVNVLRGGEDEPHPITQPTPGPTAEEPAGTDEPTDPSTSEEEDILTEIGEGEGQGSTESPDESTDSNAAEEHDGSGNTSEPYAMAGECLDVSDDESSLDYVDCTEPHEYEVYATKPLDGDWPGEDAVVEIADDFCGGELDQLDMVKLLSEYYWAALYPLDESEWQIATGRHVICVVYKRDESESSESIIAD